MQELKRKLTTREMTLPDALAKALPLLRGQIADEKLLWLASELQGYQDALTFFQSDSEAGFPSYRIVSGKMWLLSPQGNFSELNHPWTKKEKMFLSAPVSWLEEAVAAPGDTAIVDMQELTNYLAKGGGYVVCECSKEQIRSILSIFKSRFIQLLDEVKG